MSAPNSDAVSSVSVHLCARADRAEQTRLFNHCFKKQIDERALVWRYDENPHGSAVSFVSRPDSGEGVSGYACSPRTALSFGKETTRATIGETGDVMTHPEWRKKGLFSALDRACMQETERLGWPIVFGLPNRRSAHIFLDLGWEKIGTLRPWTFVLKSDAAARAERAKEGRLAGWLTGVGARRGRTGRRSLVREAAGQAALQAVELARFPSDVSELSRAVEQRFAFMVRRDADYLDWRFMRSPSGLHRAIGIRTSGGQLAGYAVVQLPRPGESTGYLVDVLARDDAAVAAAIEAGLARLEAAGASIVKATAIDGSWWNEKLERTGFLPPKAENHLIVILHTHQGEHPLARAARQASAWYLTDGDRDDETMG